MSHFYRLRYGFAGLWFAVFSVLVPINATAGSLQTLASVAVSQVTGFAVKNGANAVSAVAATYATPAGRVLMSGSALAVGMTLAGVYLQTPSGQAMFAKAQNAMGLPVAGWSTPQNPPVSVAATGGGGTQAATVGNWCGGFATAAACYASSFASWDAAHTNKICNQSAITYPTPTTATLTYGTNGGSGCTGIGPLNISGNYVCPAGATLNGTTCTLASTACPAGYTMVAGLCTLSDWKLVMQPADGTATFIANGGTLQMFPSTVDPDPVPLGVNPADLANASHNFFMSQYGDVSSISVGATAAGGLNVSQSVQTADPANPAKAQTTTSVVVTDADGVITSKTVTTVPGTLADTVGSATAAPIIDFPKDYAREVTGQATLTELTAAAAPEMADQKAIVDAAKLADIQSSADAVTAIQNGYNADKGMWFSWVWTPPVGSCQASTGTVHGVGLSVDYCGVTTLIRDIAGWLFAVYGAITIYGQLFRREA